jgi:hypothetical protein
MERLMQCAVYKEAHSVMREQYRLTKARHTGHLHALLPGTALGQEARDEATASDSLSSLPGLFNVVRVRKRSKQTQNK